MSIYSNHAAFGLRNVDGADTNCRSRILGFFSFLLCQRRLSGLLGFIFRRFGLCREVFGHYILLRIEIPQDANPIPVISLAVGLDVAIPITSPCILTSGPPELPGLSWASV